MTTASLFSPHWHRVRDRRPLLRRDVALVRQSQRGVGGHVLFDRSAGDDGAAAHRLDRRAHAVVGRCDGTRSVQRIWDELLEAAPDDAPTQDELVQLLIDLHDRGLVQFDSTPDIESIFRSHEGRSRRRRRAGVNPWAFRLAIWDPSALLARWAPLAPRLVSLPCAFIALLAVLAAAVLALGHAGALAAHMREATAAPGFLLLGWLLYPLMKALHEAAHALAVLRFGGQVRRAGFGLLLLTPVPFVDASAAEAFRHRGERAVVSGAGIAVELLLAAIATFVWAAVQPGALRDAALAVMLIGGASTLLVNGNPLMRFDGYYLLVDLLDLRNLASRSMRWWREALARHALGAPVPDPIEPLPGEARWLVAYAPLALAWQLALAVTLTLWAGSLSTFFGIAAGAYALVATVALPVLRAGRFVREAAEAADEADGRGTAMRWRAAAIVLLAAGGIAVLPLPAGRIAEGVVWPAERAQIRSETEGFVVRVAAADGQAVREGDLLVELANEALVAERAALAARVQEVQVALHAALDADPSLLAPLRDKLAAEQAELDRLDARLAGLQVRARTAGIVAIADAAGLPGRYSRRGELLGHLITADPLTVKVALPQEDAPLGLAAGAVEVRLAEDGHRPRPGRLRRETPAAVERLPSAALGDRGGGRIATRADDKDGTTPRSPVVLLDVEVDGRRAERIGGRAAVRFDLGRRPLAAQALEQARQLLLDHFTPVR